MCWELAEHGGLGMREDKSLSLAYLGVPMLLHSEGEHSIRGAAGNRHNGLIHQNGHRSFVSEQLDSIVYH